MVGRQWLLLCPLLGCMVLLPVISADTIVTVEVDGANVTVDNTVCETAAWRVGLLAGLDYIS